MLVPPAAVVRDGETTIVMVVGPDCKAHRNEVELGVADRGGRRRFARASTAGERVIVRGQNGLPDGAAVTVGS